MLQLYGCSLTAQAIWLVSELCSLGSLRQVGKANNCQLRLTTFTSASLFSLFFELLIGLNVCHCVSRFLMTRIATCPPQFDFRSSFLLLRLSARKRFLFRHFIMLQSRYSLLPPLHCFSVSYIFFPFLTIDLFLIFKINIVLNRRWRSMWLRACSTCTRTTRQSSIGTSSRITCLFRHAHRLSLSSPLFKN